MKTTIFIAFLLTTRLAMANDNVVDINIELDKKTQLITLTLTKTGDMDVVIENSFDFTKEELESPVLSAAPVLHCSQYSTPVDIAGSLLKCSPDLTQPAASNVIESHSLDNFRPYGISVMVADEDMNILSISPISRDGFINNRFLSSSVMLAYPTISLDSDIDNRPFSLSLKSYRTKFNRMLKNPIFCKTDSIICQFSFHD